MKLGTRSRIAIAATVLSTAALLGPSTPATAGSNGSVTTSATFVVMYYSDATYTVQVGQWASEACGGYQSGSQTQYSRIRYFC